MTRPIRRPKPLPFVEPAPVLPPEEMPPLMNGWHVPEASCPGLTFGVDCPGHIVRRQSVGGYMIEIWQCVCRQERTWTKVK